MSLAHLTVLDADPVTLIEAGHAGGFDAVGLRIVPPLPTDTIVPVLGNPTLQRRIKGALRETGLQILDIEAVWLQPGTDVLSLKPALDLGADLGSRYVLTVGFDPEPARLAENFGAFCDLASACGLRTMLEFIPYATIATLVEAHALIQHVRPANAGLLVDALHLSRSGGHPRDIAGYDPTLFSYIHLCDAPEVPPPAHELRQEGRVARAYPGEGGLWLDAFLDAFPAGTPVGVEAPNGTLTGSSPATRAKLAGEAARRFLDQHDRAASH